MGECYFDGEEEVRMGMGMILGKFNSHHDDVFDADGYRLWC